VPKLSATPGRITRRAPTLGEDTSAVLREIGISPEQEAALRARGVL
jgi:formyl-CoA transferase